MKSLHTSHWHLLAILLGLACMNFLHQVSKQQASWKTACERTWFQGVALLCVSFTSEKEDK